MLSSYQLCLVVFVAAQLGESLSHSTDEEHSLDGFSSDTRCGWDCIITESNFGKECDPVFTRKRLIKFNVIYDLFVNTKCLNQTSYKTFGTFTDDFYVWIPANNTLSSFSRGIKGMWDLFFRCLEEGEIRGFCNLEPGRPTTLASPTDLRTEAANTIEEKGYELITKNPWPHVVRVLLIWLSIVCTYYIPALLCLFSPTLVMESGILYIVLEGASLVSIRALVGNNVFFKDCSTVASTWYQTGKIFVVRLLFIAFLILLIAPGSIVFNITPGFSYILYLTHPFMRVCVTLYFIKAVCSLLFYRAVVSTEVRDCIACHELKSNPGACLCVDLPQRILNHVVFISSFLFLVFYFTMQLQFGVKPLTKTMVAVLIGLFPKIFSKYFEGERQKRVEALIIEEKAPKIVEAFLNSVLRANQGQENSGADTDEFCFMVFLASLVGESLSHSTEGEYSVDGFRTDTRCGWDCRITHSEFTNECGDSIFTKKRLVNFKVKFTLGIDTECSYQLRSYKLFGQYSVWIPANNTLSSFSHGIQSMWNMTFNSCFERGRIEGNCTLQPATTTALPSATGLQAVAEKALEEKGYKLISKS
ncbi:unnamed protein product [Porites lobata]|uniref:Uncharacterized protein n=1 Tax=Porites lobata TaxID=104759 RepID=A0ABN8PV95_9CNID|nr:unnamed protein product [Porites lobata]